MCLENIWLFRKMTWNLKLIDKSAPSLCLTPHEGSVDSCFVFEHWTKIDVGVHDKLEPQIVLTPVVIVIYSLSV